MSIEIITLQQARDHLRSDTSDDDADLQLKIDAATSAVLEYVTDSIWEPERDGDGRIMRDEDGNPVPKVDEDGEKTIRPVIRQAVLLTVGYLYREREGSQEHRVDASNGYGYALPQAAISLLYPLRRPTVA